MNPVQGDDSLDTAWGFKVQLAACPQCEWTYVYPSGTNLKRCPHCFQEPFRATEVGAEAFSPLRPPEMVLPFDLSDAEVANRVELFKNSIRFPPADLTYQSLASRLQRIYLPTWLVDVDVEATWEGEAGFNYQVVSHQDRFDDHKGGWTSQEVKEGRIRWEKRAGRMARKMDNVSVPALEAERSLRQHLGGYDRTKALPYQADAVQAASIRLPDRQPDDAWSDAVPQLQAQAGELCRQAAGADHIRNFTWLPNYNNQNWTLLLEPLFLTYYLDDERKACPVYIHGQSGNVSGTRRASIQRAQRVSITLLLAAQAIFVISLLATAAGAVAPPLLVVGGAGIFVAILVGLGALLPYAVAWQFNRSQSNR